MSDSTLHALRCASSFKAFTASMNIAGFATTLEAAGPLTLFAPTDAAFAALPKRFLDALLRDRDALAELLSYHILRGFLSSYDIASLSSGESLCGRPLRFHRGSLYIASARLVSPDLTCGNGVIHGVSAVLIPPRGRHGRIGRLWNLLPRKYARRASRNL